MLNFPHILLHTTDQNILCNVDNYTNRITRLLYIYSSRSLTSPVGGNVIWRM